MTRNPSFHITLSRSALARLTLASLVLTVAGCANPPGMYLDAGGTETSARRASAALGLSAEPSVMPFQVIRMTPQVINAVKDAAPLAAAPKFDGAESATNADYRIGAGDTLAIAVYGQADLVTVAPQGGGVTGAGGGAAAPTVQAPRSVSTSGHVTLPLIGDIQAAGATLAELRSRLTAAYAKYVKQPYVELSIASFRSQQVLITGEVGQPGPVAITDLPLRVADALRQAGGLRPEADLANAVLIRRQQRIPLDLGRLYVSGDSAFNPRLRDGDVISVPDRQWQKVFLLGEVTQPRTYAMPYRGLTLGEVLAEAGGPNALSANAGEVYVVRAFGLDTAMVYQLDAREPQALLLADQFALRPRDVVFINPTGLARVGRLLGQVLPVVMGTRVLTGK